jgi:hypothetical protein
MHTRYEFLTYALSMNAKCPYLLNEQIILTRTPPEAILCPSPRRFSKTSLAKERGKA